jgi:hypothetical protein
MDHHAYEVRDEIENASHNTRDMGNGKIENIAYNQIIHGTCPLKGSEENPIPRESSMLLRAIWS